LASKLLLILVVFSLLLLPVLISKVNASSEDMAASAISQAEESVASSYEAVLEAQGVRADVSGLLDQLNVAGKHLADARMLYKLGDFDGAVHSAELSSEIGEEVRNEAVELKNEAHGLWVWDLWLRMTISIVGVASVVFLSFLLWRSFKRRYHGRVLGMKPEVVSDES